MFPHGVGKKRLSVFQMAVRNPTVFINHEELSSWMFVELNNLIHGF